MLIERNMILVLTPLPLFVVLLFKSFFSFCSFFFLSFLFPFLVCVTGPGQYNLPAAINAQTKPANLQNFSTSGPRFQEAQQRSIRINVPPGKYNPITSDFDKLRIKILKSKKMSAKSDWAQHIAFVSTEQRFNDGIYDNEVPPPTSYRPKVGLAETLPKAVSTKSGKT
jgi:hypothetical protein